jgi:hypothetical protein
VPGPEAKTWEGTRSAAAVAAPVARRPEGGGWTAATRRPAAAAAAAAAGFCTGALLSDHEQTLKGRRVNQMGPPLPDRRAEDTHQHVHELALGLHAGAPTRPLLSSI